MAYAAACKAVYPSSILGVASIILKKMVPGGLCWMGGKVMTPFQRVNFSTFWCIVACLVFSSCAGGASLNSDEVDRQCVLEGTRWCADVECSVTGDRPKVSAIRRESDLSKADMSFADMQSVDLSFSNLEGVNLCASDLRDATLKAVDLSDSNLVGAIMSYAILENAVIQGANLTDVSLQGSILLGADLSYSQLTRVDLRNSVLVRALLIETVLAGSLMSNSNLCDANLSRADLSGADLRGANLRSADLSFADLRGADLRGTILIGSKFEGARLEGTIMDESQRVFTRVMPEWYYEEAARKCRSTFGGPDQENQTKDDRGTYDYDSDPNSDWDSFYGDFAPYWNGDELVECPEDTWGEEPCG